MPQQSTEAVSDGAMLAAGVRDYFRGAAGDERTYSDNIAAFRALRFRPRVLVPVGTVDTTVVLRGLGLKLAAPVIVAPMAMQRMAHQDGELAVARACHAAGLGMVLSTLSTVSIEQVADVGCPLLFQLYLYRDRQISLKLIRRAKLQGFKAIVLTVDTPRFGRRERDHRNAFTLPSHLRLANFNPTVDASSSSLGSATKESRTALAAFGDRVIDPNLSYDDLQWLVRVAGMPVWVKGIVRGDDALLAAKAGAAAIVVSNHGARQLEGAIATMDALEDVVSAVAGRVPVLVDSGVRSGEDVVRALALGADAVFIGRPVLWALAADGEQGVTSLLEKIKRDMELTMTLCGATCCEKITRDMVIRFRDAKY